MMLYLAVLPSIKLIAEAIVYWKTHDLYNIYFLSYFTEEIASVTINLHVRIDTDVIRVLLDKRRKQIHFQITSFMRRCVQCALYCLCAALPGREIKWTTVHSGGRKT